MSYQADVLALGPTVFLPLDDTAAGAAHALAGSGTAPAGLTYAQASFVGGDASKAARFDGSHGYTVPGLDFLGTDPFTLLIWVKPSGLDTSDRRIFSKESPTSGGASDGIALALHTDKIYMWRYDAGTLYSQSTGVGVSNGLPHLVAWTYDGTRSRLYLDGSKLFDGTHAGSLAANASAFTIGARSGGGNGYLGDAKDFAAWDGVALSDTQIMALYQSGMAGRAPKAILKGVNRRPGAPVGAVNVNNQVFRSPNKLVASVKVFEQATTLHRVLLPFNCENSDFAPKLAPDRIDYGRGDGGILRVRLCTLNADGTPNLANVLAQEANVAAATRYAATQALFSLGPPSNGPNGLDIKVMYFDLGDVAVAADTPYAVVIDASATPDPLNNWVSHNASTSTRALCEQGPHNAPTMTKTAPGAVAWLDPRERVMSSKDNGTTWDYGPNVGTGALQYEYGGNDVQGTSEAGLSSWMRLPWMAWQTPADYASSPTLFHMDSFYQSYFVDGAFTLTCMGVPRSCVLTMAGGLGNPFEDVGVITVTNLATGQSATTPHLGSGLQIGKLSQPIVVSADAALGDNITISNDGVVSKNENDEVFKRLAFLGATREWPFVTTGVQARGGAPDTTDFAQLFVLDADGQWPFYAAPSVARSALRGA